jgi:hypothetical protein
MPNTGIINVDPPAAGAAVASTAGHGSLTIIFGNSNQIPTEWRIGNDPRWTPLKRPQGPPQMKLRKSCGNLTLQFRASNAARTPPDRVVTIMRDRTTVVTVSY